MTFEENIRLVSFLIEGDFHGIAHLEVVVRSAIN